MVIDLTKTNTIPSLKNIDEDIALQFYKKLNLDHSSPSQENMSDSDWLVRYCHFTQEDRRLMNRITFKSKTSVSDSAGGFVNTLVDYYTCWAEIVRDSESRTALGSSQVCVYSS